MIGDYLLHTINDNLSKTSIQKNSFLIEIKFPKFMRIYADKENRLTRKLIILTSSTLLCYLL